MVYYLHDLIEDYKNQEDPDIQINISKRKEFYEKKGKSKEKPPEPGHFFNHQDLFARYARQYDRIFNIHETGTGKTASVINLVEHYRVNEPNKIKKVIVLQPGPPTVEDFKDQIIKFSSDNFFESNSDLENLEDKGVKNNLTRIINKTYEVTTYQKFSRDLLTDEKIEMYYSDCIFFFDEAHKLRNLSDSSGGELSNKETEKIYNYLWRVVHIAKRIKVIIATATPMINYVSDFVPLINLLLDKDKQFPIGKEETFYETLSLSQLEPYFRGKITFVRFLENNVKIINKGIKFDKYNHIIRTSSEKNVEKIISDKKESVKNRIVIKSSSKSKISQKIKQTKVASQITMYPLEMTSLQLQVYNKVSKMKKDPFYRNARQASVFVFPNGSYGSSGFKMYITKKENDMYQFKDTIITNKKEVIPPLTSYLDINNLEKTINNLEKLSCKFSNFISTEIKASNEERPGNCFCYLDQVEGSGLILLSLILENLGFENFTSNDSTIYSSKNKSIRQDFKKKKRFAVITGKTNNLRNILNVFNSQDNMDGEYIQIILASEVARDGINIKNVLRGYILSAGWHESGMHQALSRFIRATSHEDLKNRNLMEGNDSKIKVDVYRMAAVIPGELDKNISDINSISIDLRNYIEAENKDIKIKKIMRFMKICAFDAYLNYDRNFRKTDKDFTKEADYSVALPVLLKSEGSPGNDKRKGLAMNQGPGKKDLIFNTYNLIYSKKDERIRSFFKEVFFKYLKDYGFISYDKLYELLDAESKKNLYEILNFILIQENKKASLLSIKGLIDYKLNLFGSNFFISKNKALKTVDNEDFYSFTEITEEEKEIENIFKGENLIKIYSDLEGKDKDFIINYYSLRQNYSDFKILLEDSIIRFRNGNSDQLNTNILELFYNYFLETKIPENWFKVVKESLKNKETRKQGRKRAEGSLAGIKDLDLNKIDPGYSNKTVFVHFYRESDKTGFSITSILEGKFRKIRILDGEEFRDADTEENFIYTKIFDNFYDKLLEKYKKSDYYGSYIYRGGEQKKNIIERRREFFRIIDTTNPRNKGKVCINTSATDIQKILKFLDKERKYEKYYEDKINKNEVCTIIKNLFEKKDLLFISL